MKFVYSISVKKIIIKARPDIVLDKGAKNDNTTTLIQENPLFIDAYKLYEYDKTASQLS